MKNEIWIAPLLLLPGVALLIMSTQARLGQLHGEVHQLLTHGNQKGIGCLMFRARLFRSALTLLYASVCAFALGSMIGGLVVLTPAENMASHVVVFFTCLGVMSLLCGSIQLMRESRYSLKGIEEDLKETRDD